MCDNRRITGAWGAYARIVLSQKAILSLGFLSTRASATSRKIALGLTNAMDAMNSCSCAEHDALGVWCLHQFERSQALSTKLLMRSP